MTKNIIVCLNKYENDTDEDITFVESYCKKQKVRFAISTAFKDGGVGAIPLADEILAIDKEEKYKKLYDEKLPIEDKISRIVKDIFKANKINYSEQAQSIIDSLKENGLDKLPVVIAKTQYSISDNKDVLGNPADYEVTVRNIKLYNGAGFITVYLGSIITMPGLPKKPNYEKIYLEDNEIVGLS
jgi:formate--tetrahydrofolate ligase